MSIRSIKMVDRVASSLLYTHGCSFCLLVLLITEGGVLTSPNMSVDLLSCPFSSLHVYFMYFKAMLWGYRHFKLCYLVGELTSMFFSLGEGWGISAELPLFFGFILLFSCCLLKLNTKLIQEGRWNVIP